MRRLYAFILKLEAGLAGVLLVAMAGLIFAGGVARLMAHPINWTIDLATCFFAWAAFFCADIAWRKEALMRIEIISKNAPAWLARFLTYFNLVVIAGFLLYVIYSGLWLSWVSRARSFQGIPGVSYSWVTMSLPVGGLLLLVTTALKLRAQMIADGLLGRARAPGTPEGSRDASTPPSPDREREDGARS